MALCGVLLVAASLYYLWAGLSPWLRNPDWRALSPRWGPLAAALLAFSICPLLRGIMWWQLLSALGIRAPLPECLLTQARANLIKYVPGGFWEPAGKAYLSGRTLPERAAAGVAALLDLGAMVATGLAAALVTVPARGDMLSLTPAVRWGLLVLIIAGLLATPWALGALVRRAPARWRPASSAVGPRRYYLAVLVMLTHWVLAGVGFALLAASLGGEGVGVPFGIYALAVSATAGLLVIVAPAGVGVREALLTRLLRQRMPLAPASFAAILSRVGLVAGEFIALGALLAFARLGRWRAGQRRASSYPSGSG